MFRKTAWLIGANALITTVLSSPELLLASSHGVVKGVERSMLSQNCAASVRNISITSI